MDKFDNLVLGSLDIAQTEALKRRNTKLTPFHLAWGLIANPKAKSSQILQPFKEAVAEKLGDLAVSHAPLSLDQIRPSSKLSEWLTQASASAVEAGRSEVS